MGERKYMKKDILADLSRIQFHALLIAVEEYEDTEFRPLHYPIEDAKKLQATLQRHYTFEEDHVHLVENPTGSEILKAIDDKLAKTVKEEDQVLIFYAGHGIMIDELQQGYWLPRDAIHTDRHTWISNSTIQDSIRGILCKHILLVSDACFSGSLLVEERNAVVNAVYNKPSRKAMTSGTLKAVPDKSIFLRHLITRLTENDHNTLSAFQLFASVEQKVIVESGGNNKPQYGAIPRQEMQQGGDFVFLRREAWKEMEHIYLGEVEWEKYGERQETAVFVLIVTFGKIITGEYWDWGGKIKDKGNLILWREANNKLIGALMSDKVGGMCRWIGTLSEDYTHFKADYDCPDSEKGQMDLYLIETREVEKKPKNESTD